MDRATVYWTDCHGEDAQFTDEELDDRHRPIVLATTAWVYRYDEIGMTLVVDSRDAPENKGLGVLQHRHAIFIPAQCISRVEYLEPKNAEEVA